MIRSSAKGYLCLSSETTITRSLFRAFPALQPRRSIFLGTRSPLPGIESYPAVLLPWSSAAWALASLAFCPSSCFLIPQSLFPSISAPIARLLTIHLFQIVSPSLDMISGSHACTAVPGIFPRLSSYRYGFVILPDHVLDKASSFDLLPQHSSGIALQHLRCIHLLLLPVLLLSDLLHCIWS